MLAWYEDWSDLYKNGIWSDDVLHNGGVVNYRNSQKWARENPRITSEKMLDRSKVLFIAASH